MSKYDPNKFRIYYGDGSEYTGDPFQAPTLNVQVIATHNPEVTTGRSLCHGRDVYWWVEGYGWEGGDVFGWTQYMYVPGMPKYLIFGTSIQTSEFQKILQHAIQKGI